MNYGTSLAFEIPHFLNGVCRHEHLEWSMLAASKFLNGVCRHEPNVDMTGWFDEFLNGVCRHERLSCLFI